MKKIAILFFLALFTSSLSAMVRTDVGFDGGYYYNDDYYYPRYSSWYGPGWYYGNYYYYPNDYYSWRGRYNWGGPYYWRYRHNSYRNYRY